MPDRAGGMPGAAVRWVEEVTGPGSRVLAARRLRRGGWSVNHAVDVAGPGGRVRRLVLRRWARPGWADDDPDYTAEREARVLALLAPTPIAAPEVLAVDPDGSRCGVPALLMTRLPGHPPGPADAAGPGYCLQLARTLAAVHDLGDRVPAPAYRLYYDRPRAEPARWMAGSAVWARAVTAVRRAPPQATTTFIHRDYHPENTLWSRRRLTGVVDWTQASRGPAELDLAHMRWNLLAAGGPQAAEEFLARYRSESGRALPAQPWWDLTGLLDFLLCGDPDPVQLSAAEQDLFTAYAGRALSQLGR